MKRCESDLNESAEEGSFALGRQVTLECQGCDHDILLSREKLEKAFLEAAEESGATIVGSSFHDFSPQGVSGVVLIAESHFTVHAWPEHDYAAVDIFTCGGSINIARAAGSLRRSLGARDVFVSSDMNRGIITSSADSGSIADLASKDPKIPFSLEREVSEKKPWGVLSCADLYGCDGNILMDRNALLSFVEEFCDRFREKTSGDCRVQPFSHESRGDGVTLVQTLEKGLFSGHFVHTSNSVYLDIFSCSYCDPRVVAEFALSWFRGKSYRIQGSLRS